MIKTLSQALRMDKERFKVPNVTNGNSHPANLAPDVWTGTKFSKNISVLQISTIIARIEQ